MHLVDLKLAMKINLTKQGNVLVSGRQIYAFCGPRHSFLVAGELLGCGNLKLTGAAIHLEGKNSSIYFLCIFFFRSGCSNPEGAKY